MTQKILVVTFALALTIGLFASPAEARLTSDGSASHAFTMIDSFDLATVTVSAANSQANSAANGQANNQDDSCDEQQVPGGEEKETPSGVCYDPIDIGGSGT